MLVADIFTVVCVSLGAFFFLAGTIGLVRFPDALCRLHALSKADNLGLGLVMLGLVPQASWPFGVLKLIALWLLALLVSGATGQMLAGGIYAGGPLDARIGPPLDDGSGNPGNGQQDPAGSDHARSRAAG